MGTPRYTLLSNHMTPYTRGCKFLLPAVHLFLQKFKFLLISLYFSSIGGHKRREVLRKTLLGVLVQSPSKPALPMTSSAGWLQNTEECLRGHWCNRKKFNSPPLGEIIARSLFTCTLYTIFPDILHLNEQ